MTLQKDIKTINLFSLIRISIYQKLQLNLIFIQFYYWALIKTFYDNQTGLKFALKFKIINKMGAICQGTTGYMYVVQPVNQIILQKLENIDRTQLQTGKDYKFPAQRNSFLSQKHSSVILGCKEKQNRQYLNKYMVTYLYFLKNRYSNAQLQIKDFVRLLNFLDQLKQFTPQIQNFASQYSARPTPRQKSEFLTQQYFKNGIFSAAIQQFPVASSDPSILAYLRRPLLDLHKGIKSKYEKQQKMKQIYCVIQIPLEQQKLLNKMANQKDYFTFTTFIQCFSNEDKAKKRKKQLQKIGKSITERQSISCSTIFLFIQIPNEDIDKDYDYGFYQDDSQKNNELGDIVLNIMNFFQVTGVQPDSKQYTLKYNALARIIHMNRARLLQKEPELLKVNNLIQAKSSQIKSHTCLLRVVRNNQLSIRASQNLRRSEGLNPALEDNQRINLIEAYLEDKEFDMALNQCKNTLQFKVREAQIYYEGEKYDKVDTLLQEMKPQRNKLKKDHFQEFVIYQFISAKRHIAKGEDRKAKQQLQQLRNTMKKQYKGTYEFRGREIEREITKCQGGSLKGIEWAKYGQGLNIGLMLSH